MNALASLVLLALFLVLAEFDNRRLHEQGFLRRGQGT